MFCQYTTFKIALIIYAAILQQVYKVSNLRRYSIGLPNLIINYRTPERTVSKMKQITLKTTWHELPGVKVSRHILMDAVFTGPFFIKQRISLITSGRHDKIASKFHKYIRNTNTQTYRSIILSSGDTLYLMKSTEVILLKKYFVNHFDETGIHSYNVLKMKTQW